MPAPGGHCICTLPLILCNKALILSWSSAPAPAPPSLATSVSAPTPPSPATLVSAPASGPPSPISATF
eukprot:2568273-Rhodomonas_salina.1